MRKILILVVAFTLIVSIPLQAMAASGYASAALLDVSGQQFSVMFAYTNFINTNLSISNGTAECGGLIQPASDCSASIRVVLYRSADGSSWSQAASWSGSAGLGGTASAGGSKALSSGYQYKVISYGTVRNSNNVIVESPTKTSAIKTY